jgi:Skp family chaperone for outer membrane proteins
MPVVALVMLAFAGAVVIAAAVAGRAAAATETISAVNARACVRDVRIAAIKVYVLGPDIPMTLSAGS